VNVKFHHPLFLAEKKGAGNLGAGDAKAVLHDALTHVADTWPQGAECYDLPCDFDAAHVWATNPLFSQADDRCKPSLHHEMNPYLMGYRVGEPDWMRSYAGPGHGSCLEDGLSIRLILEPFFMGDLPEVVDAINHVSHTAHEDSCASMYYVDLPTFAKGEELKYRPRLSKEELARKLRSLESIDADGERWERESKVIQVGGSSAAEVKRKLKELSRSCHGSRGRTPVTRLVWSILAVGVEPLHIFLNLCNVSVESTGTCCIPSAFLTW